MFHGDLDPLGKLHVQLLSQTLDLVFDLLSDLFPAWSTSSVGARKDG